MKTSNPMSTADLIIKLQTKFTPDPDIKLLLNEARESNTTGPTPRQMSKDAISPQRLETTLKLGNVPAWYTQTDLLEVLNETQFGKFDFLFLRIDTVVLSLLI